MSKSKKNSKRIVGKTNLIVYGIDESRNETPEEHQHKACDFISNILGIDTTDVPVGRAHRIPARSGNRPIIMQFIHYKHREMLLKAFHQKRKQTQLQVRIGEDLPEGVSKTRTGLYQLRKDFIDQKKNCIL